MGLSSQVVFLPSFVNPLLPSLLLVLHQHHVFIKFQRLSLQTGQRHVTFHLFSGFVDQVLQILSVRTLFGNAARDGATLFGLDQNGFGVGIQQGLDDTLRSSHTASHMQRHPSAQIHAPRRPGIGLHQDGNDRRIRTVRQGVMNGQSSETIRNETAILVLLHEEIDHPRVGILPTGAVQRQALVRGFQLRQGARPSLDNGHDAIVWSLSHHGFVERQHIGHGPTFEKPLPLAPLLRLFGKPSGNLHGAGPLFVRNGAT
mmetsp:Transcript_18287/g.39565  ORF Transcript_18287/g.39565 Transcript_18287/m.39565 type:complete len:258 (+) Transcript_18287:256-1029(+)